MNDLNELLKQRAEKKLRKEADTFLLGIRSHQFFRAIESLTVNIGESEKKTLRAFFWDGNREAMEMILKENLPNYIEQEAKTFLERVDALNNND